MSDQLMARQAQRDGVGRFAPERTSKTIYIEPLGLSEVMDGECEMKDDARHRQRPLTTGSPRPSHQPAATRGVTWLIANCPSGARTNAPARPRTRSRSVCKAVRAAAAGAAPCAR